MDNPIGYGRLVCDDAPVGLDRRGAEPETEAPDGSGTRAFLTEATNDLRVQIDHIEGSLVALFALAEATIGLADIPAHTESGETPGNRGLPSTCSRLGQLNESLDRLRALTARLRDVTLELENLQ